MTRPHSRRISAALLCVILASLAARAAGAEEQAAPASAGSAEPAAPRLQFRVFGNIDWLSRRESEPSTFTLGQLDLFATAELAPSLSALAEVVLESSPHGDQQIADVERFQLRYAPTDAIGFSLGRMHTMLGFWNQVYHHGAWLQTTIQRPEVYRWEDEAGGFLPVHEVGLRFSGSASTAPLRLEYSATVANGRAARASQVALRDANNSKAVDLWLGLEPRAVPALQLGAAAVFDRIPPGDRPGRESELSERILGGFVAYQGRRLELLAEAFSVRHEDEPRALVWTSEGLYAQGAVALGRYKPYYRYDRVRPSADDPYLDATREIAQHTVGLRIDPWRQVALKLELAHGTLAGDEEFNSAAVQAAFTF